MNKITIVLKSPGTTPIVAQIVEQDDDEGLRALQAIVGGDIDVMRWSDSLCLVMCEGAKDKQYAPNLRLPGDIVAGTVAVVRYDVAPTGAATIVSLSDNEVKEAISLLEEWSI